MDRDSDAGAGERRNFRRYVGSHLLTKLGDAVVNPKTTLSWLAASLGAPSAVTAMLVPLRESGSMLAQFALAGWIQRFERRKRVWVLGALGQGLAVALMALVALGLDGLAAGLALLALVSAFAAARSLASVASKDVLGRVVDAGRRGRANGWAASGAGLVTLVLAAAAVWMNLEDLSRAAWAALLGAAALLWWLAASMFLGIDEQPTGEADAPRDHGSRLRLLRDDPVLRRFVITRALLMCSALSAPYLTLMAQRELGGQSRVLALLVAAAGLAGLLGGPAWGGFSDRSSRLVMTVASTLAAAVALAVAALAWWRSGLLGLPWVLPLAYFVLALAHQGVRIGRKTYVVDIARGNRRTDYVAVSNSAIGLLLLLAGGLGALLSAWSLPGALVLLALMGFAGAIGGLILPEAGNDTD